MESLKFLPASQISTIENCPLRFLLGRSSNKIDIPSTAALIGNISHFVLEHIESDREKGDFSNTFERLWDQAECKEILSIKNKKLAQHLLEPSKWPDYFLKKARIKKICKQMWEKERTFKGTKRVLREPYYSSKEIGLAGKVDRIEVDSAGNVTIVDWKTGEIVSADGEVLPSYKSQLYLYAVLYNERFGVWPSRGKLVNARKQVVELNLDEEEGDRLKKLSQSLLKKLNESIAQDSIASLANPSEENCKYCTQRARCDTYWASPHRKENVDSDGILLSVVKAKNAEVFNLKVEVGDTIIQFVSLSVMQFSYLNEFQQGDHLRAVAFGQGNDQKVFYPNQNSYFYKLAGPS